MRTDPTKDQEFSLATEWGETEIKYFTEVEEPGKGIVYKVSPLSGGERNRLFLQKDGNFDDYTLVSGIDFREDGRGYVALDFDRDGYQDIGLFSPNSPRFKLLRNRIGDLTSDADRDKNNTVRVKLIGGHESNTATTEYSSRDAIGAKIFVTTGGKRRRFELSCGEGLSAQNSMWTHIGIGTLDSVEQIQIIWPSGRESILEDIQAGQAIVVKESESE